MGRAVSVEIPHMIFFFFFVITFFMLMSLHCTCAAHILLSESSSFNAIMEENGGGGGGFRGTMVVRKVSGNDEENEDKHGIFLENFRVLLGLNSFKKRKPQAESMNGSPFSSPTIEAPTPAPAPAPVVPIHVHSHHPLASHHGKLHKQVHKNESENGNLKVILVAVLVSVAATSIVCVVAIIWYCRRIRINPKRSAKTVSILKERKRKNSLKKKVSFNPDIDLFYLNTLDFDLEQHETSDIVNPFSNGKTPSKFGSNDDKEESKQLEIDVNVICSSSTEGVIDVHENVEESINDHESTNGDEIVPLEHDIHSSDDDSFHSFCDSHSSLHERLSNASANSFSEDLVENLSPLELDNTKSTMKSSSKYPNLTSPAPTPPPPPPPPNFPSYSSPSSSNRIITKSLNPSKLPNLQSHKKLSSLSRSNRTPRNDIPTYPSPSPPPPPPMAAPVPAPPPPPFIKVEGNSINNHLNTPPPLPSQFTPLGKDGSPLPKLKPLHWDKVRAVPNSSMVWDKLRSSSFEFDEDMIESLFGYTLQNSMKNDEAKSKSPSPSKHVLDPKRLQNLTILSKALNVTADQVCGALVQGKGLSLQQLEAITKMVPTKEEEDKLFTFEGDINHLGSAEKFVKAVLHVPFGFLRIEAMLFRETFEDEVVHLRKSFSMLEDACKELRSSRLFLKLLEAVLKTGNRMNIGTIRGGASAFKLDALLKLSDVKGTDGKTTLLHFVVQEMIRSEGIKESETIVGRMNLRRKTIEEREEDYRRIGLDLVSGLGHELQNVKKTATMDLDVLASSVSNLSDGISNIQNLVQSLQLQNRNNEDFVPVMKVFLDSAEKKLKDMHDNERKVLIHVREITEYFHGNVSKDEANPLRIFVIVRDFLGVLDHVCKEIRSSKISTSSNILASPSCR